MPIDVIALLTPKAGKADRVEQLLADAAAAVKEHEPGTLKYHVQRETKGDARAFVVLESYKDAAAIAAHGKTEHFKTLGRTMKKEELLAEPMKVLITKEVGGYASKL